MNPVKSSLADHWLRWGGTEAVGVFMVVIVMGIEASRIGMTATNYAFINRIQRGDARNQSLATALNNKSRSLESTEHT